MHGYVPSTVTAVASSSVLTNHALNPAAALPGAHHVALGGAGIGGLIIHLFIWHEIFRLFRYLWHIPTFGPFIVVLLGLVVVGYIAWRRSGKPVRFGRPRRNGSAGYGSGSGHRDW
jgi:hypothetical protein